VTIYRFLEEGLGVPWVIQASVLACGILLAAGLAIRRKLAGTDGGVLPDDGLSVRNVFEVIVEGLSKLANDTMGEEWRRYFPVVGTIFFFILIANLMNLLPGVGGPTGDINTTAAWALISFGVYNYVGIRTHGFWYINQFLGPSFFTVTIGGRHIHVRALFWFFGPLEFILHLARILTLSVRLLANMFADHMVVTIFIGLVPVIVPAIFMGLGLMVAVLQAFVFTLLSMIYIGQALAEPH
jgi:F-type H+-transporting ATPase subunit a